MVLPSPIVSKYTAKLVVIHFKPFEPNFDNHAKAPSWSLNWEGHILRLSDILYKLKRTVSLNVAALNFMLRSRYAALYRGTSITLSSTYPQRVPSFL